MQLIIEILGLTYMKAANCIPQNQNSQKQALWGKILKYRC